VNTAPESIIELGPNDIFVFGSNLAGRHGRGAALLARQKFQAQPGTGCGLTGRCYAIPIKDGQMRVLSLRQIGVHVHNFLRVARFMQETRFLVTKIGCGVAGHTPADIAPLFEFAPSNVWLPKEFVEVLSER